MKQQLSNILSYFVLSSIFLLLFSVTLSPLFYAQHFDSYMFQSMGLLIDRGGVPYVDLFDNKGLLLYFINYLGIKIGGSQGVLLLEIFNLTASLYCWDRIAQEFGVQKYRFLLPLISLLAFLRFYCGGNLTEEWSLFPISLSFLLFIHCKQQCNNSVPYCVVFVIGLCLSSVFLLRANNMASILGIVSWWAYELLHQRSYKHLAWCVAVCFVGFILPVLFACIFMYCRGGWNGIYEMFYSSIYFNIDYALHYDSTDDYGLFSGLRIAYWFTNLLFLLLPFVFVIDKRGNFRSIGIAFSLSSLLTMLSLGKSLFIHYQMVSLPLLAVCLSFSIAKRYWWLILSSFIIFLRFSVVSFSTSFTAYRDTTENKRFVLEFCDIMSLIPTEERASIWSFNSANAMDAYWKARYLPCNKFYYSLGQSLSDRFACEETDLICQEKPAWIIIEEDNESGTDNERAFIQDNYSVQYRTSSKTRTNLLFYRKNSLGVSLLSSEGE